MLEALRSLGTYGHVVSYTTDGAAPRRVSIIFPIRAAVAAGDDIEDTGGIVPIRDIARFLASDFPNSAPTQGAVLVFDNGDRKVLTDVLSDPRGWHDCPLQNAYDG